MACATNHIENRKSTIASNRHCVGRLLIQWPEVRILLLPLIFSFSCIFHLFARKSVNMREINSNTITKHTVMPSTMNRKKTKMFRSFRCTRLLSNVSHLWWTVSLKQKYCYFLLCECEYNSVHVECASTPFDQQKVGMRTSAHFALDTMWVAIWMNLQAD